ncbi:proclotting enzyme-like [Spodoptera litura]|uniref:Phenoloxidase-activating factor 2 n=1 Tax=Spodoptera litura TaxID=69820 RepID=A0A9J7EXK9_SPOLT|nr:proclotting enzyme-like [Spodoptera litura]
MLKILPFFILFAVVLCDNIDVNALIDQIFGPTTAKVTQETKKPAEIVKENKTCTTLDGLEGECIAYYLCNATNTSTDPIIDLRFVDNACSSYMDICCHKSHQFSEEHYKALIKRSPFNEMKEKMAEKAAVQDPKPPIPADTSKDDVSCKTRDGKQGKCVPYYLCNPTNDSGQGDEDLSDYNCSSYIEVCCKEADTLSLDHFKSRRKRSTNKNVKENQVSGSANTTTVKNNSQQAEKLPVQSSHEICKTEEGNQGECVPYYLCNPNNTANRAGQIDIAAVSEHVCSSYTDVCCEEADRLSYAPLEREGCGWANPAGLTLTNEPTEETRFGEFPWMVAIFENIPLFENDPDSPKLNKYIGGGSLIHPSVVLTVAHNVHNKTDIKIRAGEWDTRSVKEPYPYQDRDVVSIEIHKDFIKKVLFYDIALLFLVRPVELAPNVGVVCLPAPRVQQEDGTRCLATGWGKDKFGKEGRYSTVLKKVVLPVVSHDRCEDLLRRNTSLGKLFNLHSTFMCAGGEKDKDTCTGDGGSPLACPVDTDRFVQSAMVAWGVGCGKDGVPGVYVDVSTLRDWIDDKVIGKGYDPKIYTYVHKG